MKTIDLIDATRSDAVVGRHAIWIPSLGLKIPFSFGGRLTKHGRAEPGHDPAETIPHELAILRALAARKMAPPIGELVRIETLISNHRGAWHADPCGAWGYEMDNALDLAPGAWSLEEMRRLPIVGSDGAWGDVEKPGNVINGYLVDVRRTAWDMLQWHGDGLEPLPAIVHDLAALRARVHRECQFPAGERAEAYQDFWIGGELARGQRRVAERADALGFAPGPGESVLDIGCQSGGFLQLAAMRGAERIAGVEVNPGYVACARALASSCGHNICIRNLDANGARAELLAWVRSYYPSGIDHVLFCSMEKHLGEESMFRLISELGGRRTYIETNAVSKDAPMKLQREVIGLGGHHVGDSADRNLRRLYRIDR